MKLKRTHLTQKMPAVDKSKYFIFLIGLTLFLPAFSYAQGNLLVTPRRIIFEGNQSTREINLANTGQDSATYAISFVQYRMTDDGRFEQIEEPGEGQNFADKMVRYFPRRVNLAPGEAQMVRMQLRRSASHEPGEYRSHMYFRAVPKEHALGKEEQTNDTTAIGIRLTPIFGITIPVIVRIGNLQASVTIPEAQVQQVNDSIAKLNLVFKREGSKSVYGDLTVDFIAPGQEARRIGLVRGLAVYTPNNIRKFQMDLIKHGIRLEDGQILIRYTNAEDESNTLLAEKTITINP